MSNCICPDEVYYLVYFYSKDTGFKPICTTDKLETLEETAKQWVIDEVGKNHYHETQQEENQINLLVDNLPPGTYYSKFVLDKTRIELYTVAEVETGWIRSVKDKTLNYIGYFAIIPIPDYFKPYYDLYLGALDKISATSAEEMEMMKNKVRESIDKINHFQNLYYSALDELQLLRDNSKNIPVKPRTAVSYLQGDLISELKNFKISGLKKNPSGKKLEEKKPEEKNPPYLRLRDDVFEHVFAEPIHPELAVVESTVESPSELIDVVNNYVSDKRADTEPTTDYGHAFYCRSANCDIDPFGDYETDTIVDSIAVENNGRNIYTFYPPDVPYFD